MHKIYKKNGIIYGEITCDTITIKEAEKMVEDRLELCNGKNYPVIVDVSKTKKMSKEARDYFTRAENQKGILASAMVANSLFSKILGNYFLKLKKHNFPTKIFSDIESAEKWIKSLKFD